MHFHRLAFALLLPSFGCEFWEDVTVPASDATPPSGVARLVELDGDEIDQFAFHAGEHISIVTSDPNREFVAIAAAWDPQGAKKVTMNHGYSFVCAHPTNGIGSSSTATLGNLQATQAGGPGSVVETGVWTGHLVSTDKDGLCSAPYELQSYTYWWSARAENFFGRVVDGGGGSITYVP